MYSVSPFSELFQVFNCPGCSEFTVDFDARCETERRLDFLSALIDLNFALVLLKLRDKTYRFNFFSKKARQHKC